MPDKSVPRTLFQAKEQMFPNSYRHTIAPDTPVTPVLFKYDKNVVYECLAAVQLPTPVDYVQVVLSLCDMLGQL